MPALDRATMDSAYLRHLRKDVIVLCVFTQEVVGASKSALSRNVGNDITALCVFTGNSCVITEESIFTSRLERRHCSMRARWK